MKSLSLSPRFDLFRFQFPKDFLPKEVEEKYQSIINKNNSIILTPIDYLNESIQGISIPGLTDLIVEQQQTSKNSLGKIEPIHNNNYTTVANPLSLVSNEITVIFRLNQGLYNYFMLYESIFHKILKPINDNENDDVLYIDLLDEYGTISARIEFFQPRISGIDGLEFSYNKVERQADTFNLTIKYNNIDFNFIDKE